MISSPSIIPFASTGSPPFSPDTLPSFHSTCIPKLARTAGKIFQDSGETVLASANNDPISVLRCTFSNFKHSVHSGSSPPSLKTDGADRWWMDSDALNRLFDGAFVGGVPYTIIIRYARGRPGDCGRCFSSSSTNWLLGTWTTEATDMFDGSFHSSNVNNDSLADFTMSLTKDASTGKIYVNGVDVTASNVAGTNPSQIIMFGAGGGEYFYGKFYGSIITNSKLSDADRINAENYLSAF